MPLPYKDWDTIRTMARHMSRRPHTVAELVAVMGVGERSVYRWLRALAAAGYDVVKRSTPHGRAVFSVERTPSTPPASPTRAAPATHPAHYSSR